MLIVIFSNSLVAMFSPSLYHPYTIHTDVVHSTARCQAVEGLLVVDPGVGLEGSPWTYGACRAVDEVNLEGVGEGRIVSVTQGRDPPYGAGAVPRRHSGLRRRLRQHPGEQRLVRHAARARPPRAVFIAIDGQCRSRSVRTSPQHPAGSRHRAHGR